MCFVLSRITVKQQSTIEYLAMAAVPRDGGVPRTERARWSFGKTLGDSYEDLTWEQTAKSYKPESVPVILGGTVNKLKRWSKELDDEDANSAPNDEEVWYCVRDWKPLDLFEYRWFLLGFSTFILAQHDIHIATAPHEGIMNLSGA